MDRALLEQARDHALTGGGAGMIIRFGEIETPGRVAPIEDPLSGGFSIRSGYGRRT